jgi:hypothetical protein
VCGFLIILWDAVWLPTRHLCILITNSLIGGSGGVGAICLLSPLTSVVVVVVVVVVLVVVEEGVFSFIQHPPSHL